MTNPNHDAIDQAALPPTDGTVLAWRLRTTPPRVRAPLTTAGMIAVLLLAVTAGGCLALHRWPEQWLVSSGQAMLVALVMWIVNGAATYAAGEWGAARVNLTALLQNYTFVCRLLFTVGLGVEVFWYDRDDLQPLAGVIAAGAGTCAFALVSTFRLIAPPRAAATRGLIKSLQEEFGTWDNLVTKLQSSPNELERRHSFFGVLEGLGLPFLLDTVLQYCHLLVTGATRSGKTFLGMLPLCIQAIRRRNCHLCYFDLKGESAVFGVLATICRLLRLCFRWFGVESGKSSYVFNPLDQPAWHRLTPSEKAQLLLASLSQDSGDAEPGPGYFSGQAERVLLGAFQLEPDLRSLRELDALITSPDFRDWIGMSRHDFENTGGLLAALGRLAPIDSLNYCATGPDDPIARESIQVDRILQEPGVTFLRLPALTHPAAARFIPRFFCRLLVAAARRRGGSSQQIILALDEVQETLQRSFATMLKQARDLGVAIWLTCQNLCDLDVSGPGMADIVLGNTSVKIFFSAGDPTSREYLPPASGDVTRLLHGRGQTITETNNGVNVSHSRHLQQSITTRISQEAINRLNATEGLCVVEAAPKSGFTALNHPVFVKVPYFCSHGTYQAYGHVPWPAPNRYTVVNPEGRVVNARTTQTPAEPARQTTPQTPPENPATPPSARLEAPQRRSSDAPSQTAPHMAAYLLRLTDPSAGDADANLSAGNDQRTDDAAHESSVPH